MDLPFLRNRKLPRVETKPNEQRLINGSADDHIDDHCMGELFDAAEHRDASKFRSALEVLVMNAFDHDGANDDE